MKTRTGFFGVYPMIYSYFGADGRLDRGAIEREIEACIGVGVHGIAILGLVSEMEKLSGHERRELLDITAACVGDRVPLAVTLPEANVPDNIALARAARDMGAAWLILQPPPVRGASEAELERYFCDVIEGCDLPVGIQNNPVNMDLWVGNAALKRIHDRFPDRNKLLKAEGPAVGVWRMIHDTDGVFDTFAGLAGKELPTNLRSGCIGTIVGPEVVDVHVQIFERMANGGAENEAAAERLYAEILPLITFVNCSVENYRCYGKRLFAQRAGLGEVHPRGPTVRPVPFGDEVVARYAAHLPPMA